MPPKLFSFIHFRKNASATPLVSHTFKTTIRPGMVVLSEHREPKDPSELSKAFRLIHFRKNASANPLESHTFKTKDLKPFRFIHFQKKGWGVYPLSTFNYGPLTLLPQLAMRETRFPRRTSNPIGKHVPGKRGWL